MRVGSSVNTDATSPNIVGLTVLGVVMSVLAVACKRMQQVLTVLAHHGCWPITQSYGVTVSNETMFKFISNMLCLCQYRPALLRF